MASKHGLTRNVPATLIVVAALLPLLATCRDTERLPDVRIQHPLKVEARTFSLAMPVLEQNSTLDSGEVLQLRTFARDYLRRGRSALEIVRPADDTNVSDSISMLQRSLEAEGIRRELVVVTNAESGVRDKSVIVLNYRGYDVKLPDCPDWSANSGFNPTNYTHSNFGCAYQRNIGMMLSDPGDLAAPRVLDRVPGSESDRVIGLFRKGEPTPAKEPTGAKGTVSGVGQQQ